MRIEYTETARKQLRKLDKTMQKSTWMKSLFLEIPEAEEKLLSRTCVAYGAIVSAITG